MNRKEIEEKVEEILEPIAEAHGVRIYDVDYTKYGGENALCAYIDKDGGVTIDDCVDVSHDLSDALDQDDPIPEGYTLYVSSPGLGRTLTKDRHFTASLGEEVEGTTYQPFFYPEEEKEMAAANAEVATKAVNADSAAGQAVLTDFGAAVDGTGKSSENSANEAQTKSSGPEPGSFGKKGKSGKGKSKSSGKARKAHREFEGVLKSFDGDNVTIGRTSPKGKPLEDLVLKRKDIAKIRLKIDF